ncbi:hypothetical protein [uncultured Chitinophaga sp.]|uniref:hypothetical protein n=1 Tax=uncultured Chitinophaga sp. TaxID=339340 RepID=UPI0025E5DF2F|nr:hypothetical protein [uncultured Chitinophaga sp.]
MTTDNAMVPRKGITKRLILKIVKNRLYIFVLFLAGILLFTTAPALACGQDTTCDTEQACQKDQPPVNHCDGHDCHCIHTCQPGVQAVPATFSYQVWFQPVAVQWKSLSNPLPNHYLPTWVPPKL